jgi:peptide/nickel transport system ATP-binding protein
MSEEKKDLRAIAEASPVAIVEPAAEPIAEIAEPTLAKTPEPEAPKSELPKPELPKPKLEDAPPSPLLQIKGLTVRATPRLELENFSLTLEKGATITLLGETGCGKEALLRVLTGMDGEKTSGTIQLGGGEAKPVGHDPLAGLRSAFLPGPLTPVLNPHASALSQLSLIVARKIGQPQSSARAELALALARLPGAPNTDALDRPPAQVAPEDLATALLACALAQTPELVIAADPLAELSPAHARALAAALKAEQKRLGFAMLYAAASADAARILGGTVIVLRTGHVVEEGPVPRLITTQRHGIRAEGAAARAQRSARRNGAAGARRSTRGTG